MGSWVKASTVRSSAGTGAKAESSEVHTETSVFYDSASWPPQLHLLVRKIQSLLAHM